MIITQPKELIGEWVAQQIGMDGRWGDFTALGKVDNKGLIVGVVYNSFVARPGGYQDCQMHVAAREKTKWASREFLHHAFSYPFVHMGCRRVTGVVAKKNKKARKFDEHIGFTFEACLKKSFPNDDAIVYRMFAEDCKWINMDTQTLKPEDIIPFHEPYNEDKLNYLVASMKQSGWQGRPLLILNVMERNYAMTGTHRRKAAEIAEINVPVKYLDTSKTSDGLLAQYLRACGDVESAFLLETEIYEMEAR